MKNFAKSILNYFAAFNETRFRFSRKLPYEWSDDPFSLEFSVFPAFQKQLLDFVAQGTPFKIKVRKGEHTVQLDAEATKQALLTALDTALNQDFLQACIDQCRKRLVEAFPDEAPATLETKALPEGLREYNLAFRRQAQQTLLEVQDKKIKGMQAELGFTTIPPSSFNPQREVQRFFDNLQTIAGHQTQHETYLDKVTSYVRDQAFDFVMFDLHPVLRQYGQRIGIQSVYVFFHEIAKGGQKYPIFSVEMELRDEEQSIVVESLRNVLMLNTPAINNFEFDTVLTTPRACRFEDGAVELSFIEKFLQAKFNVTETFILVPHFRPLIREGLPTVSYRVGLQAVKEEDRRILDYSELITNLDEGAGHKFIDMITRYVDGNVQSTADEVQNIYARNYPRKSAERLAPVRLTVPLSLNETQRKILTAVEHEKNEIIVVDGPPGTGKSYTITAIVYLANQLGKSVVITSHKKQALDVIDQALTEKFKKLHPRSKPSVLRLERLNGSSSLNNIENTLSSPVINAARTRSQAVNHEAISSDRARLHEQIDDANQLFWETASRYDEVVRKTFEWAQEHEAIFGTPDHSDIVPSRLPTDATLEIDRIRKLTGWLADMAVTVSLDALTWLFRERENLPGILEKCDQLNRLGASLPHQVLTKISAVPPELASFRELLDLLSKCLDPGRPLRDLSVESVQLALPDGLDPVYPLSHDVLLSLRERLSHIVALEGKFLGKLRKSKEINQARESLQTDFPGVLPWVEREGSATILARLNEAARYVDETHARYPSLAKDYILQGARDCSPERLKALMARLNSLEFNPITTLVAELLQKPFSDASLREIREKLQVLDVVGTYLKLRAEIQTFAEHAGVGMEDLSKLYATLKKIQDFVGRLEQDDMTALSVLFRYYASLLKALNVDSLDLASLGRLADDADRAGHVFRFIQLHTELSACPLVVPPGRAELDDYLTKTQKLLEYQTDGRLSNLLNHAADVQRIQTAIAAGKRITSEQARVLLKNLSCIISEPGLISQHFPMEPNMFDLLIIDEASQVSIAESISLMLRARQTIVFGDELQYGAVAAVNVSQRYAAFYFKDILRDYSLDRKQAISEEERDRIAREASATPSDEEEESSRLIPIDPGTREWLKTFSVRTSTLAFAKALRNYSESLNVHFRSFPEIISYSSEFFYKESQIDLVANRIRTKPIKEVLRFIKVETKGLSGKNVNLDEIEAIQKDLAEVTRNGYKGTIGVICSFRDQAVRMEEIFRQEMVIYPDLVRNHKFKIWFVGDVQGEERDMIYYSFVEDKKFDNASLRDIYPIIGGTADNIRRLKMQRLNVGFSRAKDIMVFVHSMPLGDYSDTRLGDALRHYEKIFNTAHDHYIEDESVFGSPAEKELYTLILQTKFFQVNRDTLRLIAQFEMGKYIRDEYHRNIPNYRVDFLLTKSYGGKEKSLVLEYDGVEFHTRNPDIVTRHNFDQEYLEYDVERQLELESYGYSFLRINKFSLMPTAQLPTRIDVLNALLEKCFADH